MPNKPHAGARRCAETILHRITDALTAIRGGWPRIAGWGLAVLCAAAASILLVPGRSGAFGAALAAIMIAIAAIDAREFRIPNELVLIGVLLGLAEVAIVGTHPFTALANAVIRAAVLVFLLMGFRYAYRAFRRREGLGLGDVKLSAVAGVWLSWMAASLAIELAGLVALATVLIGSLSGNRISGATRIPFGLFFAPAIWLAWLLEATILQRTI